MNKRSESETGKRFYVWVIATSTLLLLGLFLWPLSVSEFRTTSKFSLRYQPTSGIDKSTLNNWVVASLRKQTDRAAIADIIEQVEVTMTSSVLNSLDPETIRSAIHIQGRPGTSANSIEYRLSMIGEGSTDEIEFLNLLVSRINNQLDRQLSLDGDVQVVEKLSSDLDRFHTGRLEQLSGQLADIMVSLNTAENDIKIVTSDLQSLQDDPAMLQTQYASTGAPAIHGRPENTALQALYRKKQMLLEKPGMTEYHPEVTSLQREIETVKGDLATVRTPVGQTPSSGSGTRVVKNPFVTVSAPASEEMLGSIDLNAEPAGQKFFAPIKDIIEGIELVDLSPARTGLVDVQDTIQNFEASGQIVSRLNKRAISDLQAESPIALSGFEMASRGTPIGGSPGIPQFLLLFMTAGIFGSLVMLNYDPAIRKTPFRSVDQLQRKLSVPVIGVLRNQSLETPRPFNKRAAARLLQICEWTLLALAVLLIIAALANSEVAAAFIENPFHGLTKTIWLMSPAS